MGSKGSKRARGAKRAHRSTPERTRQLESQQMPASPIQHTAESPKQAQSLATIETPMPQGAAAYPSTALDNAHSASEDEGPVTGSATLTLKPGLRTGTQILACDQHTDPSVSPLSVASATTLGTPEARRDYQHSFQCVPGHHKLASDIDEEAVSCQELLKEHEDLRDELSQVGESEPSAHHCGHGDVRDQFSQAGTSELSAYRSKSSKRRQRRRSLKERLARTDTDTSETSGTQVQTGSAFSPKSSSVSDSQPHALSQGLERELEELRKQNRELLAWREQADAVITKQKEEHARELLVLQVALEDEQDERARCAKAAAEYATELQEALEEERSERQRVASEAAAISQVVVSLRRSLGLERLRCTNIVESIAEADSMFAKQEKDLRKALADSNVRCGRVCQERDQLRARLNGLTKA